MLVFCTILYPSVHPPHPFSSCWRGHNITFFMDKTKQFLYVFVDMVNTSFSMETTIVIWFLDMATLTFLLKKQENKWHIYWQCWEYVYGNKKIIYFGSSDCYHYRAFEEMIFLQLSYKTFKPCFTVILCHERWASKWKVFYQIWSTSIRNVQKVQGTSSG